MGYVKRRIRQGRGVASPSEDSLSQRQTNMLVRHGYSYSSGAWRPPGHGAPPRGHAPTSPAKTAMKSMLKKRKK